MRGRRYIGDQRDDLSVQPVEAYRDLFSYDDCSLAWLRVFRVERCQAIALVLEPRDNPGRSAVNAAETLVASLHRVFAGFGDLRTFVRWVDDPRGPGWTELVMENQTVDFVRYTAQEVDDLVGAESSELAAQGATCADLAGKDHPLLALIPPPEVPRNPLDDLRVIAVADLPWPHNPSRCGFAARFNHLEELYPSGPHTDPAVGAHWFLTLSESDFSSCPYHKGDWERVSEAAVDILRTLEQGATLDDAVDAAYQAFGESVEGHWCESLFRDPIVCGPREPSVTNGQHRACALRASGAHLCVVDADGMYVPEPIIGDPVRRAAAELAAFWARQAGA